MSGENQREGERHYAEMVYANRTMGVVFGSLFLLALGLISVALLMHGHIEVEREALGVRMSGIDLNSATGQADRVELAAESRRLRRVEFVAQVLQDIGIILLPLNLVGLLIEFLGGKRRNAEILDLLPKRLKAEFGMLEPAQVTRVWDHRPEELAGFLASAKEHVDIIHTNFTNLHYLKPTLEKVAKRGVKVRFTLLHPESSYFDYRYETVGRDSSDSFRLEVANALLWVWDYDNAIEKRVDRIAPTLFVYRADTSVIAAFMLWNGRSKNTVHFGLECLPGSGVDQLLTHIDDSFSRAKPLPSQKELRELITDFARA